MLEKFSKSDFQKFRLSTFVCKILIFVGSRKFSNSDFQKFRLSTFDINFSRKSKLFKFRFSKVSTFDFRLENDVLVESRKSKVNSNIVDFRLNSFDFRHSTFV